MTRDAKVPIEGEGSRTPRSKEVGKPSGASALLELTEHQDRHEVACAEAERRLRWVIGASVVSPVFLALHAYSTLFIMVSNPDYLVEVGIVLLVVLAVWRWWHSASSKAGILEEELTAFLALLDQGAPGEGWKDESEGHIS